VSLVSLPHSQRGGSLVAADSEGVRCGVQWLGFEVSDLGFKPRVRERAVEAEECNEGETVFLNNVGICHIGDVAHFYERRTSLVLVSDMAHSYK